MVVVVLMIVMECIGNDGGDGGTDGDDTGHHSSSLSEIGSQWYHLTCLVTVPTVCAMSFSA